MLTNPKDLNGIKPISEPDGYAEIFSYQKLMMVIIK